MYFPVRLLRAIEPPDPTPPSESAPFHRKQSCRRSSRACLLRTKPTHPHPRRTRACFRGKPSTSTTPSRLPVSLIRKRKRETKTRRIERRSAYTGHKPIE